MNYVNIINLKTVSSIQKWLRDTNNVYVGREVPGIVAGSKWGNPYELKYYSRTVAIAFYESHLDLNEKLANSVSELRGKVLGCWCSPSRCHAETLHRLAGNQPVYHRITRVSKMVTKQQLDESLGTLKNELATQLKAEIKIVVDESILAFAGKHH